MFEAIGGIPVISEQTVNEIEKWAESQGIEVPRIEPRLTLASRIFEFNRAVSLDRHLPDEQKYRFLLYLQVLSRKLHKEGIPGGRTLGPQSRHYSGAVTRINILKGTAIEGRLDSLSGIIASKKVKK